MSLALAICNNDYDFFAYVPLFNEEVLESMIFIGNVAVAPSSLKY